jgi:glutamate 5-kinase
MRLPKKYNRVVVKVGSSLFSKDSNKLDTGLADKIAKQVSDLVKHGKEVVLVSSGAIALGMSILKLDYRPKKLQDLQAAAAIGQHELMHVYKLALAKFKLNCAQLLLTWDDFLGIRYLNAKRTLNTLLKLNCVPIINENDSVATEEIKLGDNDRLSALVAQLVGADLLIILSDVEGLLDKNKKIIRRVEKITGEIKALACPTHKKICVGGMVTKIEAARIAVEAGVPCVIANGRQGKVIIQLTDNPFSQGTIFLPR